MTQSDPNGWNFCLPSGRHACIRQWVYAWVCIEKVERKSLRSPWNCGDVIHNHSNRMLISTATCHQSNYSDCCKGCWRSQRCSNNPSQSVCTTLQDQSWHRSSTGSNLDHLADLSYMKSVSLLIIIGRRIRRRKRKKGISSFVFVCLLCLQTDYINVHIACLKKEKKKKKLKGKKQSLANIALSDWWAKWHEQDKKKNSATHIHLLWLLKS